MACFASSFVPNRTLKAFGAFRCGLTKTRYALPQAKEQDRAKLRMADSVNVQDNSPISQALSFEALQLEIMANNENKSRCPGCGVTLQYDDPDSPGYVPPNRQSHQRRYVVDADEVDGAEGQVLTEVKEEADEEEVICQRCYKLSHYGVIANSLRVKPVVETKDNIVAPVKGDYGPVTDRGRSVLSAARFRACLGALRRKSAVIVYLVDIFDFNGSFLTSLQDIVGKKNPILLAVNKVDLLPRDYKQSRVEKWVRAECESLGLHQVSSIHLISSTRGLGVSDVMVEAQRVARTRRCDIYVIGAANVGKSSFINKVVSMRKGLLGRGRPGGGKSKKKSSSDPSSLTTSVIPGTTLDMIQIPLGHGIHLYDTPGIIVNHQLTNRLNSEELKSVLPSKSVERSTVRLGEGKSLFLGGLARIDVLEGKPFFFTVFVSSRVKLHLGKTEGAEDFAVKHTGELLTPPYDAERFHELGQWTSKTFTAHGVGWKRACTDIVLSGLGWVACVGSGSIKLRVSAPYGIGVFTRDALMPFEVQAGVSKYTGSSLVNKRKAKSRVPRDDGSYVSFDDWQ